MSARSFEVFGTKRRFGNVTVQRDSMIGTFAQNEGGYIAVILHSTAVATLRGIGTENQTVTLSSGGWRTTTTKSCINNALRQVYDRGGLNLVPCVTQRRGDWFVHMPNGQVLDFEDGMTLPLNLVNTHSVKGA